MGYSLLMAKEGKLIISLFNLKILEVFTHCNLRKSRILDLAGIQIKKRSKNWLFQLIKYILLFWGDERENLYFSKKIPR